MLIVKALLLLALTSNAPLFAQETKKTDVIANVEFSPSQEVKTIIPYSNQKNVKITLLIMSNDTVMLNFFYITDYNDDNVADEISIMQTLNNTMGLISFYKGSTSYEYHTYQGMTVSDEKDYALGVLKASSDLTQYDFTEVSDKKEARIINDLFDSADKIFKSYYKNSNEKKARKTVASLIEDILTNSQKYPASWTNSVKVDLEINGVKLDGTRSDDVEDVKQTY